LSHVAWVLAVPFLFSHGPLLVFLFSFACG